MLARLAVLLPRVESHRRVGARLVAAVRVERGGVRARGRPAHDGRGERAEDKRRDGGAADDGLEVDAKVTVQ